MEKLARVCDQIVTSILQNTVPRVAKFESALSRTEHSRNPSPATVHTYKHNCTCSEQENALRGMYACVYTCPKSGRYKLTSYHGGKRRIATASNGKFAIEKRQIIVESPVTGCDSNTRAHVCWIKKQIT